jgi:hypothetical protein
MSLEASLPRDSQRLRPLAIFAAFLFAIALLPTLRLTANAQDLETQEPPSTIHGTVINSVTRAPIARALVFTADERFATLTDGDGHFEFPLPKNDNDVNNSFVAQGYSGPISFGQFGAPLGLRARKPGFLDFQHTGAGVEASSDGEITLSLTPEALIKGRVTLSTSDAPLGLTVQLFSQHVQDGLPRWVPGPPVQTNSAGEFRFADLQAGAYKVVTHEYLDNDPSDILPGRPPYGFPPVYYPNATDFTSAETIQLTAGQSFDANLSLSSQAYYRVKIPVANSESAFGMSITVSLQGQDSPGYSLGYNADKHQIEGLLPAGNYQVAVRTSGQDQAFGSVNLKVAGAPAEGPTLTLSPSSLISLNVTEEFNDSTWNGSSSWSDGRHHFTLHGPRAYLNVTAEPIDNFHAGMSGTMRPPSSQNDQSLVLESLAPGTYWLRLNTSRGYVASATMGTTDVLREPLVVGSGSNANIEIKMRDDGAEIEGTVTDVAGGPIAVSSRVQAPPAWVYCVPLPDSHGQFQQLPVSSDGTFSFSTLAPGSYRVLAFSRQQPELPYRDPEAMRAYESKGQVIQVAGGQKAKIQLQLIASSE